jgi:hypothetical protein
MVAERARPAIAPARVAHDRWQLWLQVIDHRLLPPLDELERILAERREAADRLWADVVAPALAGEFAELIREPAPASVAALRGEIKRVASGAYGLATSLYRLHGRDDALADATGVAALWLTLVAAVVDQLVDDGLLAPDTVRAQLNPTAFLAALAPGAAVPVTHQPYLDRVLACGIAALRGRLASARSKFDAAIVDELRLCLREMINGQLDSPSLGIRRHAELADVDATLRRVNTLTVWIGAYLGLLGAAHAPAPACVRAVRDITTRLGEIGWALDALSDIHVDLAAGVWSQVWLELARTTGLDAPWLAALPDDPDAALDALEGADVCARLLARIAIALEAIEHAPDVDAEAARDLARLCRYMVWAFLVPASAP